jgi:hypothetical protein
MASGYGAESQRLLQPHSHARPIVALLHKWSLRPRMAVRADPGAGPLPGRKPKQ